MYRTTRFTKFVRLLQSLVIAALVLQPFAPALAAGTPPLAPTQHVDLPAASQDNAESPAAQPAVMVETPAATVTPEDERTKPTFTPAPKLTGTPAPMAVITSTPDSAAVMPVAEPVLIEDSVTEIGVKGGKAVGWEGRVSVEFPEGALEEAVTLRIGTPSAETNLPYSLSGNPFEITAIGREKGLEVSKFSQPITITVKLDENRLNHQEELLTLFYYDFEMGTWMPLPSQVDKKNNILIGWSKHFTPFDIKPQGWEAARLPSLEAFQVSSFTGAGTYSFPIQVPPGPGGLQPSLAVSYGSQMVDNASSRTQASWAGMGWSLDTPSIQRNMNGTNWSLNDDTFSLQLNGVGGTLLGVDDAAAPVGVKAYRLTDDNFYRIWHYNPTAENSYWVIWDRSGTQYFFEERSQYPLYPETCVAPTMQTWQWALKRVRNVLGQELTYAYTKETASKVNPFCPTDLYPATSDVAIYPATIVYPNGKYTIEFTRTARSDYDPAWASNRYYLQYKQSLLSGINVWHTADGEFGDNDDALIRRYQFNYNYGVIFPGVTWPNNNAQTPGLASVVEQASDPAHPGQMLSLPATTFTYADGMHLTEASNGYGGKISYTYEPYTEAWHETSTEGDPLEVSDGLTYVIDDPDPEVVYPDPYPYPCDYYKYLPTPYYGRSQGNLDVYYPGRTYMIEVQLAYDCGTAPSAFKFGFIYSGEIIMPPNLPPPQPPQQSFMDEGDTQFQFVGNKGRYKGYVHIPITASKSQFFMKSNALNARREYYKIWLVETHYRVKERAATDEVLSPNAPITTTYRYDAPATNDAAHSAAVSSSSSNDELFTPANSEFRGHGLVQQTGPDKLTTTTFYHQDDVKSGSAALTIVGAQNFYDDFNTWNTAHWSGVTPSLERKGGDPAIKIDVTDTVQTLVRPGASLWEDEAVLVQFQVMTNTLTANPEGMLAVDSGTWNTGNYRRWGVRFNTDKSVTARVWAGTVYTDTSLCDRNGTCGAYTLEYGKWYSVLLIQDSQGSLIRIWPSDNQADARQRSVNLTTPASDPHFAFALKNGTGWVDTYSEEYVHSLSDSLYATDAPVQAPESERQRCKNNAVCVDLIISWNRLMQSTALTFNGDAGWVGTRTDYVYDLSEQGGTQYGNQTRTIQYAWDPTLNSSQGGWKAYRATRSRFYPNVTTDKYLVGLPANANTFKCPNGACGLTNTDLLASTWNLYDGSTTFASAPITGMLTGNRTFVCFANDRNQCYPGYDAGFTRMLFNDQLYGYDSYGNRTSTKQYTGYGYYINYLNRWLSPDSIVPDLANPQSLNRYSYVNNRPLNFTDPSGHIAVCGDEKCPETTRGEARRTALLRTAELYGVSFTGAGWDNDRIAAVINSANAIDRQFRRTIAADSVNARRLLAGRGRAGRQMGETVADYMLLNMFHSPGMGEAFRTVFGNATFTHVAQNPRHWGETFTRNGQEVVEVYDGAFAEGANFTFHFPAHELGHAFAHRTGGPDGFPRVPYNDLANTNFGAFAPGGLWQQSASNTSSEDFADMFLGWSYNHLGVNRNNWMNSSMPRWVALAVTENQ